MPRSTAARGEEGAVAILYSVALLLMLGLLALTIDIGALRYDRANSQTIADMASVAGALDLHDVVDGHPQKACRTAWHYFLANSAEDETVAPDCTPPDFPDFMPEPCPADTREAVGHTESYEVHIYWPVHPGDLFDPAEGDPQLDGGDPCERIAVRVFRTRGFVFGSAVGQTSGSTGAPAVARAVTGETSEDVVSLLLLDKIGCNVLDITGMGGLRVLSAKYAPPDGGPQEDVPGRIHVDSDGSKSGNPNRCFNANDVTVTTGGNGYIVADGNDEEPPGPGVIRLFAMPAGAATCTPAGEHDCKQTDIAAVAPPAHPGTPDSKIWPQPANLPERTNRTPADHSYNCKGDYEALDGEAPYGLDWNVPACDQGTAPYVDQLESAIGNATSAPSEFNTWTAEFGADSCDASKAVSVSGISLQDIPGNWYVDCPDGFTLSTGDDIRFISGNVVFAGTVKNTGGNLSFNAGRNGTLGEGHSCLTTVTGCLGASSGEMAFVYVGGDPTDGCSPPRTNHFEQTSGTMTFDDTMAFIRDGAVKLNGGDYTWTSPDEGPFEDLALWGDRPGGCDDEFSYQGGGSVDMLGVFFSPNATTDIAGSAGQSPREAQFFTWRMKISGGGGVLMEPNPDKALTVPTFEGVLLIR